MDVGLSHYLMLSLLVFMIGFSGMLLNRHSLLSVLMSLELMLLSVSINFVAADHFLQQLDGQVMVFFVLACAACEAAIGLAIFAELYRTYRHIDANQFNRLQG